MDQRNRTENPEMNPGIYRQLMYEKEARICNAEKTASSSGVGKTRQLQAKESNGNTLSYNAQI